VKRNNSETTGQAEHETPLGSIGSQLGEIGFGASLTVAPKAEVSAWLAGKTPEQADAALVSLVQQCGAKVSVERRTMFPETGGFRSEVVAVHVHGEPLPKDQLDRLQGFLTPAETGQIERWIARLSVMTARRNDDDMTEALRLRAYTERLEEYPADVVKASLDEDLWKFFPTWKELLPVLEQKVRTRRQIMKAAKNAAPKAPPPYRVEYDAPPKERGPRPFIPEPKAPQPNVEHLREELELLKADKELSATEHGQAYAQSLIERIAQAEARKTTTQEAV
jgi:hypothetical protein